MLENGADIRYIQALLGHSDLSTTEVYTRVSILQLKAVHDRRTRPGCAAGHADRDTDTGSGRARPSVWDTVVQGHPGIEPG